MLARLPLVPGHIEMGTRLLRWECKTCNCLVRNQIESSAQSRAQRWCPTSSGTCSSVCKRHFWAYS